MENFDGVGMLFSFGFKIPTASTGFDQRPFSNLLFQPSNYRPLVQRAPVFRPKPSMAAQEKPAAASYAVGLVVWAFKANIFPLKFSPDDFDGTNLSVLV